MGEILRYTPDEVKSSDNNDRLQLLHRELLEISSPNNTMTIISKCLFLKAKEDDNNSIITNNPSSNELSQKEKQRELNHSDSYKLLIYLVSTNPSLYLKVSSKCIQKQTQELTSFEYSSSCVLNNNKEIIVTDEMLHALIDQLNHDSSNNDD